MFLTIPTLLLLSIISNKILNLKHFYLQIYSKFNRIIIKCGQKVVNMVFNFYEPRWCNSSVVGSHYILINLSARTDAFLLYHNIKNIAGVYPCFNISYNLTAILANS